MNINDYINDLYIKLAKHKENVLNQKGKSDIETQNYYDEVDTWYNQILKIISETPPTDFVKSILVFQDSCQIIKEIKYVYCDENDYENNIAINIFWI